MLKKPDLSGFFYSISELIEGYKKVIIFDRQVKFVKTAAATGARDTVTAVNFKKSVVYAALNKGMIKIKEQILLPV